MQAKWIAVRRLIGNGKPSVTAFTGTTLMLFFSIKRQLIILFGRAW